MILDQRSSVAECLLILSDAMEDSSDMYLRFDQGGGGCWGVRLSAIFCWQSMRGDKK